MNYSQLLILFGALGISWGSSPSSLASQTVCPSGSVLSGVDVSDHQSQTRWSKVQQSGRTFAFVKATEGITFQNPDFNKDWLGSKAAGLIRGAYHYFVAADDPVIQADAFLSTVGEWVSDDMPPMFDWENSGTILTEDVIQNAQIWLDRVETATGMTPVIYTIPYYWNSIGAPPGFDRYPLFIANYQTNCPTVPKPWANWTFWQHAIASTTGIGIADQDYFNGSLDFLEGLLHP